MRKFLYYPNKRLPIKKKTVLIDSNSSKISDLDGIPFAINPIFLLEPPKTSKNKKLLNYNFEKAMSILDCKVKNHNQYHLFSIKLIFSLLISLILK